MEVLSIPLYLSQDRTCKLQTQTRCELLHTRTHPAQINVVICEAFDVCPLLPLISVPFMTTFVHRRFQPPLTLKSFVSTLLPLRFVSFIVLWFCYDTNQNKLDSDEYELFKSKTIPTLRVSNRKVSFRKGDRGIEPYIINDTNS